MNFSIKACNEWLLRLWLLYEEIPKRLGGEDDRHKEQSARQVDNEKEWHCAPWEESEGNWLAVAIRGWLGHTPGRPVHMVLAMERRACEWWAGVLATEPQTQPCFPVCPETQGSMQSLLSLFSPHSSLCFFSSFLSLLPPILM